MRRMSITNDKNLLHHYDVTIYLSLIKISLTKDVKRHNIIEWWLCTTFCGVGVSGWGNQTSILLDLIFVKCAFTT